MGKQTSQAKKVYWWVFPLKGAKNCKGHFPIAMNDRIKSNVFFILLVENQITYRMKRISFLQLIKILVSTRA